MTLRDAKWPSSPRVACMCTLFFFSSAVLSSNYAAGGCADLGNDRETALNGPGRKCEIALWRGDGVSAAEIKMSGEGC